LERGAHSFLVAEAATAGDAVDALLGLFQNLTGGFHAKHLDRLGRRTTSIRPAASGEVSRAHADAFGEQIEIQAFAPEVLRDPKVQILEGRRGQGLRL
jgi:hypothetical protein